MKNNLAMWIFPAGIVIGVLIGGLIRNAPLGIAIGAVLSMIATLTVQFFQNRKRKRQEDDHKI